MTPTSLTPVHSWKQSDTKMHYVVDLPGTIATVPLSFFSNKQNIVGQFAIVENVGDGFFEAVRDPLGIGKQFYTEKKNGELEFSGNFVDLLKHDTPVYALPRGQHVRFGPSGERKLIASFTPNTLISKEISTIDISSVEEFHKCPQTKKFKEELSNRLDNAFELIKNLEKSGHTIFIAMSGGLDSSTIANLAYQHLDGPIACTLDLGGSEDAEKSSLISKEIGIKHIVFNTNTEEILDSVADSPKLCQDYRDFNVHCTALNILLAKKISDYADQKNIPREKRVVLTGDMMNEFTCDYAEEVVDGKSYYRLPRVKKKMLQRTLINGLDTSDREIMPFREFGLLCIQPYAVTYDLYTALPDNVLQLEDVKLELNGHLVPKAILELLPKSKLRAQVGSKENMGVLGLCHRHKIDETFFLEKLLAGGIVSKEVIPIIMGKYDVERFE